MTLFIKLEIDIMFMFKYLSLFLVAIALALSFNVAFANIDDMSETCIKWMSENNGWRGGMMGGYNMMDWSGMGFGGVLTMIFAIALWVVFWAVTIVAIVALVRWIYMKVFKGELLILSKKEMGKENAEEVLKLRYAKGDISKEEYEEMRKEIVR